MARDASSLVSGRGRGRRPIKGAANEARLCPDHLASDFEGPPIVTAGEQRHDHAVVAPEVDDVMRSEPDRFVGLVQRLVDLPAQGIELRNIPMGAGIARVQADRVAAFDDCLVDAAAHSKAKRKDDTGQSRRQAPPVPRLAQAATHVRHVPVREGSAPKASPW